MDMRIPSLNIKIMLESNPLKSRILERRLAVHCICSLQKLGITWSYSEGSCEGFARDVTPKSTPFSMFTEQDKEDMEINTLRWQGVLLYMTISLSFRFTVFSTIQCVSFLDFKVNFRILRNVKI